MPNSEEPKDGEIQSLVTLYQGGYDEVIRIHPELAHLAEQLKALQELEKEGGDEPLPPIHTPNRLDSIKLDHAKRLSFLHERNSSRALGPQGELRSRTIAERTCPIPIERIIADTDFRNIRLSPEEDDIESLMRSMSDEGLKVPVTVLARPDGDHFLRAGFRRVTAARRLGWTLIPAIVMPWNTPRITEHWTNIIENSARRPLRTYEIANAALIMERDFDVSSREFALKAGYDPKYIHNLLRAIKNLPPMVLDNWRGPDSMSIDWYFKWASMHQAEAIQSFLLERGRRFHRRVDPMLPTDHPRPPRKARVAMASNLGLRRMQRLRDALVTTGKVDEPTRLNYLEIVDYCLGIKDTVLDIYDYRARHRSTKGRNDRKSIRGKTTEEIEESMRKTIEEVCTGIEDGMPVVSDVLPIDESPPEDK
jgi:ParB/RepB/Spo0J family partition protein